VADDAVLQGLADLGDVGVLGQVDGEGQAAEVWSGGTRWWRRTVAL
jgi:hypothetical protein